MNKSIDLLNRMKYIYTISQVGKTNHLFSIYRNGGSDRTIDSCDIRCVGWYNNLKDARKSVENDDGLFNEAGYYQYIVIEKMREGIYPCAKIRWWFEYNDESHSWLPIDDPDFSNGIVNYGIG